MILKIWDLGLGFGTGFENLGLGFGFGIDFENLGLGFRIHLHKIRDLGSRDPRLPALSTITKRNMRINEPSIHQRF